MCASCGGGSAAPPFRAVVVRRVEARSPRLTRVVVGGADLGDLTTAPAASVRLNIRSAFAWVKLYNVQLPVPPA